jgi:hypothetical protein
LPTGSTVGDDLTEPKIALDVGERLHLKKFQVSFLKKENFRFPF